MNKTAVFVAVLVATLVFSSFAVFAFKTVSESSQGVELTSSAFGLGNYPMQVIFACPAKAGTCATGACDEDLGASHTHACHYPCSGGSYGAGEECGTNMCYGGECQSSATEALFSYVF